MIQRGRRGIGEFRGGGNGYIDSSTSRFLHLLTAGLYPLDEDELEGEYPKPKPPLTKREKMAREIRFMRGGLRFLTTDKMGSYITLRKIIKRIRERINTHFYRKEGSGSETRTRVLIEEYVGNHGAIFLGIFQKYGEAFDCTSMRVIANICFSNSGEKVRVEVVPEPEGEDARAAVGILEETINHSALSG